MPSKRIICGLCLLLTAAAAAAQEQEPPRKGWLRVTLPDDAMLVIDGKKTKQTGPLRFFYTPPLQPGKNYHYTLEWSYRIGGQTYKRTRIVNVRANEEAKVDLTKEEPKTGKQDKGKKDKPEGKKTDTDPGGGTKKKPEGKRNVPSVPSPPEVMAKMLELAKLTKKDVVYNLGCGDGRLAIAAAEKGMCEVNGFANDEALVRQAKKNVKDKKLEKQVLIEKADIFSVDLKAASVVLVYLDGNEAMAELLPQLKKMKPGSRIVSHDFWFEGYRPKQSEIVKIGEVQHRVHLWETPLVKK